MIEEKKNRGYHVREFENKLFENICDEYDIARKFSSLEPHTKLFTPKRKCKNNVECTQLAKIFGPKQLIMVCCIGDRVFINQWKKKTSYQICRKKKKSKHKLFQFGCKCFILNYKEIHKICSQSS